MRRMCCIRFWLCVVLYAFNYISSESGYTYGAKTYDSDAVIFQKEIATYLGYLGSDILQVTMCFI